LQFAISPGYARTSYNIQGMTVLASLAAVMNLCISGNMSPANAYIALSRVQKADDALIMQPFSLEMFQQGVSANNRIMMAHFRRDEDEVQRLITENLKLLVQFICCRACGRKKQPDKFLFDANTSISEMSSLVCNSCKKECGTCGVSKDVNEFTKDEWHKPKTRDRFCNTCATATPTIDDGPTFKCSECDTEKNHDQFPAGIDEKRARDRVCTTCQNHTAENTPTIDDGPTFKCSECDTEKNHDQFPAKIDEKRARDRVCTACQNRKPLKCTHAKGCGETKDACNFEKAQYNKERRRLCRSCQVKYCEPGPSRKKRK
jgi:hypothetical protein